ncbi:thaumatin family protein [Metarhizium robertsii]|uniref:Thaumatin family protein n=1 Tax=Metarhizium robertsii TaxID=568076 RepID=A0A0A1UN24_9HYPO|nr:thaumatin family protein [Metarhizium robertsii]
MSNAPVDPTLDPLPAGYSLRPGTSVQTAPLPLPWGGRIWARHFCSASGADCLIGGCSHPSCWFTASANTTLFEIHAAEPGPGPESGIYYDISLACWWYPTTPNVTSCLVKSQRTLASTLPDNRGARVGQLDDVYGCLSNCAVYKGIGNCCRPGPEGRGDCMGANPWFKAACPDAYAFASDDPSSIKFSAH